MARVGGIFFGRQAVEEVVFESATMREVQAMVDEEQRERLVARQALERADALLLAHLDDEQRAEYALNESFVIQVPSGRRYRISSSPVNNVAEIDEHDHTIVFHCAYAPNVPLPDHMLTQKLVLQAGECRFLNAAYSTVHDRHFGQGAFATHYFAGQPLSQPPRYRAGFRFEPEDVFGRAPIVVRARPDEI